jgi:glycosyltransferase involved in cell wall biosynthesis
MKDSPTKTICFFNSNKAWGGGEKWHFTTAVEFKKRGYRTFLATNEKSELANRAEKDGVEFFRFFVGNLSFLNVFKVLSLMMFFRREKVDAVILNLPSDLKLAGIAAKLAGVKKIIYRRGMPHPLRGTMLNRFLFLKVLTNVVVNSKEIGRTLEQGNELWFPKNKLVLIYNGVDSSKPFDRTVKLYQKVGDELVIGNAGRLTDQKGQKYLIEAAEMMKKDGVNFKILIAGEGELKEALQKMIDEKGLQDQVKLIGHVTDMAAFMNSLDVFAFPSLFEGSANTLIEALYYEKPIVAWDVSSNGEIVLNQDCGVLIEFKNVPELRKALTAKYEVRNVSSIVRGVFDSKRNLDVLEKVLATP